jgi:hypothetical protein
MKVMRQLFFGLVLGLGCWWAIKYGGTDGAIGGSVALIAFVCYVFSGFVGDDTHSTDSDPEARMRKPRPPSVSVPGLFVHIMR